MNVDITYKTCFFLLTEKFEQVLKFEYIFSKSDQRAMTLVWSISLQRRLRSQLPCSSTTSRNCKQVTQISMFENVCRRWEKRTNSYCWSTETRGCFGTKATRVGPVSCLASFKLFAPVGSAQCTKGWKTEYFQALHNNYRTTLCSILYPCFVSFAP